VNLKVVPNGPYTGQYKLQNNKDTIAYIHVDLYGRKELSFLSHRFQLQKLVDIINFVDKWQYENIEDEEVVDKQ